MGLVDRWRPRLIRLGIVSAFIIAGYLFRSPLLQVSAWGLIVPETTKRPSTVLLFGGQPCFDELQNLSRSVRLEHVLVIEWEPDRLVRTGLQPTGEAIARTELDRRSLPPGLVAVVPGSATSLWDAGRQLKTWMSTHTDSEVLVLCPRFTSREHRRVFSRVLGRESASRVHWFPVRHQRYDESDWWKLEQGQVDFFSAYLGLWHVLFCGEGPSTRKEWDADEWVEVVVGKQSKPGSVGQL